MRIEEHLALHDPAIKAWVYRNISGDLRKDAEQNIRLAMIEYHAGGYDHDSGELLTALWPYLRGIAFTGEINREILYGVKHDLDALQEMAEKATGRYGKDEERGDKIHLDPLYESPIDGLKTPRESTLTPEEQERAEKLTANLTDEDREILEASYGRSERQAAAILGMPKTTYRDRLKQARERAEVLLRLQR
jgi:hypothetical protein